MTLETTMITIEEQQVQLQTHAMNKQDAIRQVGQKSQIESTLNCRLQYKVSPNLHDGFVETQAV